MVFATSCPKGCFTPHVPHDNDNNGLIALVAVFKANEIEEKKNRKLLPVTRNKKRKLIFPDAVTLVDHHVYNNNAIALPRAASLTPPPPAAVISNEEGQKIGYMVCWLLVDKYDEHNSLGNTSTAYNLKIVEFKLYCKTFYNNDAILMYQVTRGKVVLFLTYNFQSQEGPQRELPNWTMRGQTKS